MKLHVLSDLHNEFSMHKPPQASREANVIVLAGDIWKQARGIGWARETWPNHRIIYVIGNHEYYGEMRKLTLAKLHIEAKKCDIDLLDNAEVIIDGVRFLGATLWTDFELFGRKNLYPCIVDAQNYLTDYRAIHEAHGSFSPVDAILLHRESIKFLKRKLNKSFNGKTVVVTHHLPTLRSVSTRFVDDGLTPSFASNLDYLISGDSVSLWIHGHTHDSFDYQHNGTRILCNPRGYVTNNRIENNQFNPNLIVEI